MPTKDTTTIRPLCFAVPKGEFSEKLAARRAQYQQQENSEARREKRPAKTIGWQETIIRLCAVALEIDQDVYHRGRPFND